MPTALKKVVRKIKRKVLRKVVRVPKPGDVARVGARKSLHIERDNGERADFKFMVRMKPSKHARLQMLANRYAGGNLSAWILYAAENAPRVFLQHPKAAD